MFQPFSLLERVILESSCRLQRRAEIREHIAACLCARACRRCWKAFEMKVLGHQKNYGTKECRIREGKLRKPEEGKARLRDAAGRVGHELTMMPRRQRLRQRQHHQVSLLKMRRPILCQRVRSSLCDERKGE